jgi:hypothetical protein
MQRLIIAAPSTSSKGPPRSKPETRHSIRTTIAIFPTRIPSKRRLRVTASIGAPGSPSCTSSSFAVFLLMISAHMPTQMQSASNPMARPREERSPRLTPNANRNPTATKLAEKGNSLLTSVFIIPFILDSHGVISLRLPGIATVPLQWQPSSLERPIAEERRRVKSLSMGLGLLYSGAVFASALFSALSLTPLSLQAHRCSLAPATICESPPNEKIGHQKCRRTAQPGS